MKLGLIGNTELTLEAMTALLAAGHQIPYLFGLSPENLKKKVNAVELGSFCLENKILLDTTENWDNLLNQSFDLVICLGDSRIVPETVLKAHKTIGNHGAPLPAVHGGASLVWGRMLNAGYWGVSLMELAPVVDTGLILGVREFDYQVSCTMREFVELADQTTVELLFDYLTEKYTPRQNKKWAVKVAKHTDSMFATYLLEQSLKDHQTIYLPTRTPDDAVINSEWSEKFKTSFKLANDSPYPRWIE